MFVECSNFNEIRNNYLNIQVINERDENKTIQEGNKSVDDTESEKMRPTYCEWDWTHD